ncbi:MAG: tetratricopeptide repeat protein [Gammaproteobacteria bacterium]|nr:tetratricopeptide repeat protein [Gammaproteobacteria bacterium]
MEQKAGRSGSERKAAKHLKKANKQYGKAKRKFAKAIEHEPQLYQAHSRMGYARHQTGDYEGALKSYDIALRLKPRNAQIIGDRAQSHLALGRLAEVQSAHQQLQKLDRSAAADLKDKMLAWQKTSDGDKPHSGEASIAQFD